MMRPRPVLVLTAAMALCAVPAWGQLIGKIPPAPPPTPEYTPPAPRPASPPRPAEPEKPLPSLAVKDADGRLRRYPEGAERAAIAAMGFDAPTMAKIAASEAHRMADIRRMVVEKLPEAVEARRTLGRLDTIKDVNSFDRIKGIAAPMATERLSDRLMRDNAITPAERSRIDRVVKDYKSQLKDQWQQETGSDYRQIFTVIGRDQFVEVTRDAMRAMDGLLLEAAPTLAGSAEKLHIRPDQRAQFDATVSAIAAAPGDDQASRARRLEAVSGLFMDVLDADQRKALLEGVSPAE